jgi:Pertussis toxin, subunit 1
MRSAVEARPVTTTPWRVTVAVIGILVAVASIVFASAAMALRHDRSGSWLAVSYAYDSPVQNTQARLVGRERRSTAEVPNSRPGQSATGTTPLLMASRVAAEAVTASAPSEPADSTLFRADTRPPEEIFQEGFEPKGSNMDLWEHVTQNPDDSGYVSTSKTFAGASGLETGDPAYIYELHAEGIDVNATFGEASPFPSEEEVAVPRSIPSCDIVGCTTPGGDWVPNPSYAGR